MGTIVQDRKFFVSFTVLLKALANGLVTQEDLNNGLFFFAAVRRYVMGTHECAGQIPEEVERVFGVVDEIALDALARVRNAVRRAEQKKTIGWRKLHEHRTCTMVNELLERNGYAPISGPSEIISHPDIALACERAGLRLVVIHSTWALEQAVG